MTQDQTSKDLELFHFGVKGMKWGVKRSDKQLASASKERKSIRQKVKDRDESIKKARDEQPGAWTREVQAFNKSVKSKGSLVRNFKDADTRTAAKTASDNRRAATANRKEVDKSANRKTSKEIAIKGATYAVPVILSVGYVAAGTAATRKNAKIGETLKNDLFADSKGLPAPGTIALNLVNGVWQ